MRHQLFATSTTCFINSLSRNSKKSFSIYATSFLFCSDDEDGPGGSFETPNDADTGTI